MQRFVLGLAFRESIIMLVMVWGTMECNSTRVKEHIENRESRGGKQYFLQHSTTLNIKSLNNYNVITVSIDFRK